MKEEELAQQLENAGFPSVTRWEIENTQWRKISSTGVKYLPPIGALLSEIENPVLWKGKIWRDGEEVEYWFADSNLDTALKFKKYADSEANREAGYENKEYIGGYIDTSPSNNISYGEIPEIALTKLYITIANKE
jgi:hypothetical protein